MHIHRTTDQIAADRSRYEAHQRLGLEFSPRASAEPSPRPAPTPFGVLTTEVLPGGWYTTIALTKGHVLRVMTGERASTVSLAVWSAADTSERMNLPDTIKVQWTTELRKGRVIFSDMGRVLMSIIEDSSGAHDALTGGSTAATTTGRNTRDNMVLAAAKLGLDRRDLPSVFNLFAPVRVNAADQFEWRGAMLAPGDWVDLRAEMDLILALSNCPHPLDPVQDTPPPIALTLLAAQPLALDDLCRTASAEAQRGFENNARA